MSVGEVYALDVGPDSPFAGAAAVLAIAALPVTVTSYVLAHVVVTTVAVTAIVQVAVTVTVTVTVTGTPPSIALAAAILAAVAATASVIEAVKTVTLPTAPAVSRWPTLGKW